MSDANKFLEKQEMKGKKDQGISIPLLMQNKVPDGFEAEEGALKVDIRPDRYWWCFKFNSKNNLKLIY